MRRGIEQEVARISENFFLWMTKLIERIKNYATLNSQVYRQAKSELARKNSLLTDAEARRDEYKQRALMVDSYRADVGRLAKDTGGLNEKLALLGAENRRLEGQVSEYLVERIGLLRCAKDSGVKVSNLLRERESLERRLRIALRKEYDREYPAQAVLVGDEETRVIVLNKTAREIIRDGLDAESQEIVRASLLGVKISDHALVSYKKPQTVEIGKNYFEMTAKKTNYGYEFYLKPVTERRAKFLRESRAPDLLKIAKIPLSNVFPEPI